MVIFHTLDLSFLGCRKLAWWLAIGRCTCTRDKWGTPLSKDVLHSHPCSI